MTSFTVFASNITIASSPPRASISSLDHLPQELLCHIYSFLPPITIKRVRLLNKLHRRISSQYLLPRVYWAIRPKTIEVFKNIVAHPVFSKSVTEIVYDASFFAENFAEDDNYAELYDFQDNSMWTNWKDWGNPEKDDVMTLERAVRSLPNLRSIYYTNWFNMEDSIKPWYLEVGPMAWDLSATTRLPQATTDDDPSIPIEYYVSQTLAVVLEHLLKGGAKIQKIELAVGATCEDHLRLIMKEIRDAMTVADDHPKAVWKRFLPNMRKLIIETESGRELLDGDALVKRLTPP